MIRVHTTIRWVLTIAALLAVSALFTTRTAHAAGVVGTGSPASCTESAFDTALIGGGTVTFNCGANPVTITITFAKQISTSTYIDGANKITIKASNAYHFQVYSGKTLTLKNLKLTGGVGTGAGSISNIGTLKIIHSTFYKNKSTDLGGVIYNNGTLNIKNSTFTQNKATNGGGVLWNDGGTAKIKGSNLSNNKATGDGGAGGAIGNKAGTVTIISSILNNNTGNEGGAVWTEFADSTTNISKSTLDGNHGRNGAGIENFGDMTITLSTISNNIASNQGGGIMHGGSLEIQKSTISGNQAVTGGGLNDFGNSTDIQQSTFSGNHSSQSGGGVYSTASPGIRNSTFSGNSTGLNYGGGAFYANGGDVSFEYVTIANNSATFAGGVYSENATNTTVYFQNTVLSFNLNGNCDGGEFLSGGHNVSSDTFCGSAFTEKGDKNNLDPKLGPLANNGGPTFTHLPLPGSPLINKGYTDNHIKFDQRSAPRPVGSSADIGSVEVQ